MRKELEEALQKKAVFDGPEWQNWMMRKDVIDPSNMQHLRSQDNGYLTSFLASTALGGGLGLLGDQLTGGNHTKGSVLGGAAGGAGLAMLANLVGKGAGYITPTRTKAKHDKYQNSGTAAEWLIPGVANYNKVKTYGYSLHGREKNKEAEPKEDEQNGEVAEGEKKTAAAAFGAIPAIGNALSPAPAPATIAKPQQQATTAQNQQQQAQNQAGEQTPQADTNTIADLTASLNKITDVAKNSIKPSEQQYFAQNSGGETAQAEAVSGALKAASARYTKIASDRKRAIIYGIINNVMK